MKISFITFGGRSIGTGHLFRCLAIAEWIDHLEIKAEVSFHLYDFSFESQDAALDILLKRSDYNCYVNNLNSLKGLNLDTVIVDLLDAPKDLMHFLTENSNFIISIDNISKSRQLADIAINPLYYKTKHVNLNNDFIGPRYQIISPNFFVKNSRWRDNVKKILVIQGGSDPYGISPKIVAQLESLIVDKSVELNIVVGPASKEYSKLMKISKKHPANMVVHKNIKQMNSFLESVDIAISSIGIVAFELASMGIPAIHITGVEKELETAESMCNLGVSMNLGLFNEQSDDLINALSKLIDNKPLRMSMRESCLTNFNSEISKKMIELISTKGDK